jgi:hypothetical protein
LESAVDGPRQTGKLRQLSFGSILPARRPDGIGHPSRKKSNITFRKSESVLYLLSLHPLEAAQRKEAQEFFYFFCRNPLKSPDLDE